VSCGDATGYHIAPLWGFFKQLLRKLRSVLLYNPQSLKFCIAGATMCASFGVERPAVYAAAVHLAREQVGDDRAQDENAAEDGDAQERILQPLYFSLNPRW
jgi:hypothetical protein